MKKNDLVKIIDPLLKNEGYARKGNSWYKDVDTLTSFLSLERSRWGDQYYVAINALFKHLLQREKFSHHVAIRFETLVGDETVKAFDLENEMEDQAREKEIASVITTVIPTLKKFESTKGINEVVNKYNGAVMMTKAARELIHQ